MFGMFEEDEDGAFYGDPRRCRVHGHAISSGNGLHDGLCGACEYAMETSGEEVGVYLPPPPVIELDPDDDLPF